MSRRWSEAADLRRDGGRKRVRMRHLEGVDVLRHRAALSWPATLRAARGAALSLPHLRAIQRGAATATRTVFLLDCSASMLASGALAHAKGLLMPWLRALRRQDAEAVVIGFGGGVAQVRFGPAVPRGWSARWLVPIAGGGGTPLDRGVTAAQAYGRRGAAGKRVAAGRPVTLVVLTDGRSDEQPARPDGFDAIDIVLPRGDDAEAGPDALRRRLGQRQAARLALAWGGRCFIR